MSDPEIQIFAALNNCDFETRPAVNDGLIRDRRTGEAFTFSRAPQFREGLQRQLAYQITKMQGNSWLRRRQAQG